MLRRLDRYSDIDKRKLMDLYAEGNRENAAEFYPDEDPKIGVEKVERECLAFLKDGFMPKPENSYWVLEQDGVYLSALRLTELPDRLFYLEALETHPDHRRNGHAVELLKKVTDALKKDGPFRICDCVGKRNTASVKAHEKAGFSIVSEQGYDYLSGEAGDRHYGLEYVYQDEQEEVR